jgi:TRAP-type mannitol/chloroaromatic compound transport system permease small subunit
VPIADEAARREPATAMKLLMRVISLTHAVMAVLFVGGGLLLILMAIHMAWTAVATGIGEAASQKIIEAIGLLAAAVVALQIAQTVAEEEVVRAAHVSGPTRVRRFLSRFLVVLVVALAIEGLVATFRGVHENLAQLPYAACIVAAAALLLAGWGLFIKLNVPAEKLEPEAMEEAKREDRKLA